MLAVFSICQCHCYTGQDVQHKMSPSICLAFHTFKISCCNYPFHQCTLHAHVSMHLVRCRYYNIFYVLARRCCSYSEVLPLYIQNEFLLSFTCHASFVFCTSFVEDCVSLLSFSLTDKCLYIKLGTKNDFLIII